MTNKVGQVYKTNNFGNVTIIDYINYKNCTVQFEDGTIVKNKNLTDIKRGEVRNPYHPTNMGIGFLGVGKKRSKKCLSVWSDILIRGYDKKFKNNQPTYKNVTVCEEWHNFQNFAKWFEENYVEGWQIDKDILIKGNKIYSPEACAFVPHEINSLFTKNNVERGKYLIGVSIRRKSFCANINKDGNTKYLGSFKTEIEAFNCYKKAKEDYIKKVADKWKNKISKKVYNAMYNYKVKSTD